MDLNQRTERIVKRIETLAKISEEYTCLTRTFGSPALKEANDLTLEWMQEAGLKTQIDNIGNVRGRLVSTYASAKTFFLGSHLDSVKNGGKYDGPLGLLIALEVVDYLNKTKRTLPFHIEVVGFCDEEGVRFTTTYLGSSALSNIFQHSWLERRDDAGLSLAEVIERNGRDPANIQDDALNPDDCLGFYEVHIEQGPILERDDIPVGIVSCIAGQTRAEIRITGKAGHAGTTPMHMRQDALCAAAHFISAVEAYVKQFKESVVATVGKLIISPNVSNVIPSQVICSLDLRSSNNEEMLQALKELEEICMKICVDRNVSSNWTVLQQNNAVYCDDLFCTLLEKAIPKAGISKIISLPSGAGHDAVALSKIMPVSMLFVQCKDGISHHPDESVKIDDIYAALQVSDLFMEELIHDYQSQAKPKINHKVS